MGDPLFRETAVEIFLDNPVDLEIRVSSDRGGEVRIIVCFIERSASLASSASSGDPAAFSSSFCISFG